MTRHLPKALALLFSAGLLVGLANAQPGGPGGPGPGPDGPNGPEDFFANHDLDGDGSVSADEFGRSHPIFQKLDANADGIVDTDEIEAMRESHQLAAAARFAHHADADRDRSVTADEWSNWLSALDADQDGELAPEEIMAARGPRARRDRGAGRFQGRGGPSYDRGPEAAPPGEGRGFRGRGARAFGALDLDDDGTLRVAELDSFFGRLDLDGNGTLESTELEDLASSGPRPGPHGRRGRGR